VPVTVTVTNTLDCNKPPLAVAKKVVNNTGGPLPPGLGFLVTVTCGTTSPQPLTLIDGQPAQMVPNVGFNSSCSLNEAPPPPPPPQICPANLVPAWSTAYSPSSSVTIANLPVTVTVTTPLDCNKPPLAVAKKS